MNRQCSEEGCERLARSRGKCNKHYKWLYEHGVPLADIGPTRAELAEVGICVCDRPAPDNWGECQECFRPVVTFMRIADAAQVWPNAYARAVACGALPPQGRAAS